MTGEGVGTGAGRGVVGCTGLGLGVSAIGAGRAVASEIGRMDAGGECGTSVMGDTGVELSAREAMHLI